MFSRLEPALCPNECIYTQPLIKHAWLLAAFVICRLLLQTMWRSGLYAIRTKISCAGSFFFGAYCDGFSVLYLKNQCADLNQLCFGMTLWHDKELIRFLMALIRF